MAHSSGNLPFNVHTWKWNITKTSDSHHRQEIRHINSVPNKAKDTKKERKKQMGQSGLFFPVCWIHSGCIWVPAVWRKWKQRHRRRYRQTFDADAQTQTQTRSHNTAAGGWWMMFGLRRLHFIREEDKLCAKVCVLWILWVSDGQAWTIGKCQLGGTYHIRVWTWSSGHHLCHQQEFLKATQSALRWWITYSGCHVSSNVPALSLDVEWSLSSSYLPQAELQMQSSCPSDVPLISPIEGHHSD